MGQRKVPPPNNPVLIDDFCLIRLHINLNILDVLFVCFFTVLLFLYVLSHHVGSPAAPRCVIGLKMEEPQLYTHLKPCYRKHLLKKTKQTMSRDVLIILPNRCINIEVLKTWWGF